jgi:Leucine-rich repeat (LRR) protein
MSMQFAQAVQDDFESLSSMRLVCRSWRDAVSSACVALQPKGFTHYADVFHRPVKLDFSARHFSPVMHNKDLQVFEQTMRTVQRCVLNNMQNIQSLASLVFAEGLLELSLEKSNVTDGILLEVLPKLTKLQKLNIQGCMFLRGEFLRGLEYTQDLKVLKMGACGVDIAGSKHWNKVVTMLCRLEELSIMNNLVSDESIKVLQHCSKLQYLDIRKCPDITFESLYFLSLHCLGLQTLKVGPIFNCSIDEIWQLIPKLTALHALEISGQVEHTERPLTDILDTSLWQMPPLKKISLIDSYHDWSTIKALSVSCGEHLEYLNISQTRTRDFVSQTMADEDAVHFPKLTCLKCMRSRLPLESIVTIMKASSRLQHLDVSFSEYSAMRLTRMMMRRQVMIRLRPEFHKGRVLESEAQQKVAESFAKALGSLQYLQELKIASIGVQNVHLEHLPNLVNLKVLDCSDNRGIDDIPLGRAYWPSLEVLNIANTSISADAMQRLKRSSTLKHLKELYVSVATISGETICDFVSGCRELRCLHMIDMDLLDDESLGRIVKMCPKIQDLSLAGCQSLSPMGLLSVAGLRDLVKLDLSRCKQAVTDDAIQHIISNCDIGELHLSGHGELSKESLQCLLDSKMLHYADISFCFGMGNDDECAKLVTNSGSPIKIRLPQGSTRLGLFEPSSSARRSLTFV